jgi:CARDB
MGDRRPLPIRPPGGVGTRRGLLAVLAAASACLIAPTAAMAAKADLKTAGLTVTPATVAPGGVVTATDTVVNRGKRKAKRSTSAYFLSPDERPDATDRQVGSRRVKALKPRKRNRGTAGLAVPADTLPGSYRVISCADDGAVVREKKDTNNCAVAGPVAVTGTLLPPTPPTPPGPPDADGDGVPDATDCAPTDPAVFPGALDDPDLAFIDTNCDGIDGDPTRAIFVAPTGDDNADGTPQAPKQTIAAAIAAAQGSSPVRDIYAAAGTYGPETVALADDVSVFGGYSATDWSRSAAAVTRIDGAPAVSADGVTGVELQLLELGGQLPVSGLDAYGLRAVGSTLTLTEVDVQVDDGGDGGDGAAPPAQADGGLNGVQGNPGAENSTGFCGTAPQPAGGAGGGSPVGNPGGKGGDSGLGPLSGDNGDDAPGATLPDGPGVGGQGTPPNLGLAAPAPSARGHDGADGTNGPAGAAGAAGFDSSGYAPSDGDDGENGTHGLGGGGGGGGGGGESGCDSYGSSGGGGGGGGAGGSGGDGGKSGGGSFALYLWASNVTVQGGNLTAGAGGDGGDGANGQSGGGGGEGRLGGTYGGGGEQDDGSMGGAGGNGGDGGDGGAGGGGAGGPSIGILQGGGSTAAVNAVVTLGTPGLGGASSGNSGPDGDASNVLVVP